MNIDEENTMTITWHVDDVLEKRPDLSKDQARKVLSGLGKNHDATIGINWDVIETTADMIYPSVE